MSNDEVFSSLPFVYGNIKFHDKFKLRQTGSFPSIFDIGYWIFNIDYKSKTV
jgi:hypothetical protein